MTKLKLENAKTHDDLFIVLHLFMRQYLKLNI